MRYISTRGKADPVSFEDAVLLGLARDGGLYVPESYPRLDISHLRGSSYVEVAFAVMLPFADGIPPGVLYDLIKKTYTAAKFGTDVITPVTMPNPRVGLLELSNGPTLAFKDLAMQFLAATMEYVLSKRGETCNILGSTSGDTGGAAIEAFRGKRGINVFMMQPHNRTSAFQRRQMTTVLDGNIFNLIVKTTFDGCQDVVKVISNDSDFKVKHKLTTVNSINWARVLAQVVYYVSGYLQATTNNDQRITFVVPMGNVGNILGAYIAREMGLPIDIIGATNENDVLNEFFTNGIYRPRPAEKIMATSSPSMDIGNASNLERMIHMCVRDDTPHRVAEMWNDLKTTGHFDAAFLRPQLSAAIRTGTAREIDVIHAIRQIHAKYGRVIDPHTAVAMYVGLFLQRGNETILVAETAQPAKFAGTIREALGFDPPVPAGFEDLMTRPERFELIEPDAEFVKQYIAARV